MWHPSTVLFVLGLTHTAFATIATSAPALTPFPSTEVNTSPNPAVGLQKRTFCYYTGTCNYHTDPYNCGHGGHVCPSPSGANAVATCSYGYCSVACAPGYDYSYYAGRCIPVSSDTFNCGACGTVCSIANSASATCEAGVCYASSCQNGFKLSSSYTCIPSINLTNDVKNCGKVANVCLSPAVVSEKATCVAGVCGIACATGYGLDLSTGTCRDTLSDYYNCGECGTTCDATGTASATCYSGVCYASACLPGYQMGNYVCNKIIQTATDTNNCGSKLNVCPTSYANGSGSVCLAGVCQPSSCATGYSFNFGTGQCQNTVSDSNNCGAIGLVCSFAHGTGVCINKVCTTTSCTSGYTPISGVCTLIQTATDVNNCGALGTKCAFKNGVGSCVSGKCKFSSCKSPNVLVNNVCTSFSIATDVKNCGTIGNVCQATYLNGGAGVCNAGVCSTSCNTGFAFDFTASYCRPVTSDIANCGSVGNKCVITGGVPGAVVCTAGKCMATACSSGFGYPTASGTCAAINTVTDVNNCGQIGALCSFVTGSTGACVNSVCTILTCPLGYAVTPALIAGTTNSCKLTATAAAHKKRSKVPKRTLCPAGESACPIAGSASYASALVHHFSTNDEVSGVMLGPGGYECLDTSASLESCGGCASTGEGVDCTAIKSAIGVGCDAGKCVVFSCAAGSRPNLAGTHCVKVHEAANNRSRQHAARHLDAHLSSTFHI